MTNYRGVITVVKIVKALGVRMEDLVKYFYEQFKN